eukprot:c15273_g1_i2.p2 GENE.c15273_g1_i2~~c15273_g1_i2.p2  ORF type:complete len:105 (+),score=15.94 c15273_g1_i2:100-414(+)
MNNAAHGPSLIEFKNKRFLITSSPTNDNLPQHLVAFQKHGVTDLVRTCEPSYSDAPLESAGITVHPLPFPDGAGPPQEVVRRWLEIVRDAHGAIAIHCVAGLGR